MRRRQDGSRHEGAPGQWWDPIVAMDDANNDIYPAFFVAGEGAMSSFQGIGEAIEHKGLFCSLYADRGSPYWHTPDAGGKIDKDDPTQLGRALQQPGIGLIPACSLRARGRSERMFGTLQNRPPQELRSYAIATIEAANRFLKDIFLPAHNARFVREPEDAGSAFAAFAGKGRDILCVQEDRVLGNDNTVRYKGRAPQIAAISPRQASGSTNIPTERWPSSTAPGASAAIGPTGGQSSRRPIPERPIPERRREPRRRRPNAAGQTCGRLPLPPVRPAATTTEADKQTGDLYRTTYNVLDKG